MTDTDKIFAGSIPKLYEAWLVPLIFEAYAADLTERISAQRIDRLLEVAAAGFAAAPRMATVAARSRAESAHVPAVAYCQGTPLRNEIEARDPTRLTEATELAARWIARRFGSGAVDGKIQAHVVTVLK